MSDSEIIRITTYGGDDGYVKHWQLHFGEMFLCDTSVPEHIPKWERLASIVNSQTYLLSKVDDLTDRMDAKQYMLNAAARVIRDQNVQIDRLETENGEFRSQFADADEIEALLKKYGGDLTKAGWKMIDYRAELAKERALADQLADALGHMVPPTCWCIDLSEPGQCAACEGAAALAAYEAARKEEQ